MTTRLALVGFGRVGRAFAKLLLRQREELRQRHGLDTRVTAILTRHHGWARDDAGIDLRTAIAADELPERGSPPLIAALSADVLIEVSSFDARTGEPALSHVRDALRSGMHAITANEGPIAHAHAELDALARERGRALRFEATLAGDLPVFSLARYALPAARVRRVRGIVNGATNFILSEVAGGSTFAAALSRARRLEIADRDPANDLKGWTDAARATILANVLLGSAVRIGEVRREAITPAVGRSAAAAARRGKRVRPLVVVTAESVSCGPATLAPVDALFAVEGSSMAVEFVTDLAGTLVFSLHSPGVEQTAFALLADLVDIAKAPTTIRTA